MTEPFYHPIYFDAQELLPPEVYSLTGNGGLRLFDTDILQSLDAFRDYCQFPFTINTWREVGAGSKMAMCYRGYRPPSCKIGAPMSGHKKGVCFDISCSNLDYLAELVVKAGRSFRITRMENPKITIPKGYIHLEFACKLGGVVRIFNP